MTNQKHRVQRAIREWLLSEAKKSIAEDSVIPSWIALWKGMRNQCARETGLSLSTINRYWNGAVAAGGKFRTFECLDIFGIKAFDVATLNRHFWF